MVKGKTNNTLIKVEGLKLAYGSHLVLENINFEVEQGRCLVVMGGSGCGKSWESFSREELCGVP